ncbi:MAG: hypothetical protein V4805_01270 [Pseudomonadota bacterium]
MNILLPNYPINFVALYEHASFNKAPRAVVKKNVVPAKSVSFKLAKMIRRALYARVKIIVTLRPSRHAGLLPA